MLGSDSHIHNIRASHSHVPQRYPERRARCSTCCPTSWQKVAILGTGIGVGLILAPIIIPISFTVTVITGIAVYLISAVAFIRLKQTQPVLVRTRIRLPLRPPQNVPQPPERRPEAPALRPLPPLPALPPLQPAQKPPENAPPTKTGPSAPAGPPGGPILPMHSAPPGPPQPQSTQRPQTAAAGELERKLDMSVPPPIQVSKPSTVSHLVKAYSSCWDTDKKAFNERIKWQFDVARLNATFDQHNQKFGNKVDYNHNYGFIEKRDLKGRTRVFVRADLHGDLKSLLENLKAIQKEGLLDENFKCKPDVLLVFLGDYMDRGNYSLQVAEILACLRLENPDQVILIRGNHEECGTNRFYGGPELQGYLTNDRQVALLDGFYQTMPLTAYVGQVDLKLKAERQYLQMTHGTFELTADPVPLLASDKSRDIMAISSNRLLSDRVFKLVGDSDTSPVGKLAKKIRDTWAENEKRKSEIAKMLERDEKSRDNTKIQIVVQEMEIARYQIFVDVFGELESDFKDEIKLQLRIFNGKIKALKELLKKEQLGKKEKRDIEVLKLEINSCLEQIVFAVSGNPDFVSNDRFLNETIGDYGKLAKGEGESKEGVTEQQKAARRILELVVAEELTRSAVSDGGKNLTAYYWGDIEDRTCYGNRGTTLLTLSPRDVRHYLVLCSTNKIAVKCILRGHQHFYSREEDGKELVAITLPIGMDADPGYVSTYTDPTKDGSQLQDDRAYIMVTDPEIGKWTKRALFREKGSSETRIEPKKGPVPFASAEV